MLGKKSISNQLMQGMSLIEVMIVISIMAVVLFIAVPEYQNYVQSARISVLNDNIQSIRLMQDERRNDLGEYIEGEYVPGVMTTLSSRLGWAPRTDADSVTYQVTCTTDGSSSTVGECARSSGYTITATHSDAPNEPVSRTFNP